MGSFWIGWQGCLHDKKMQNELISYIRQYAEVYNKYYFGRRKDSTTLEFFDNTFYEGKILIPIGFFNITQGSLAPENYGKLNHELFGGNLKSIESVDDCTYFVCNRIRLNGIQFKINTDLGEDVFDKHFFSKVSFVFFDFGDDQSNRSLISNNIVQADHINDLILLKGQSKFFNLKLRTNGFTYRYRNMDFVFALCVFAKQYFIKDMEIDAFGCRSSAMDLMKFNDPDGILADIKNEAHRFLMSEFQTHAAFIVRSEIRTKRHF